MTVEPSGPAPGVEPSAKAATPVHRRVSRRELAEVSEAQRMLREAASAYVVAARRDGATWAQIGHALGVSRQAAAAGCARVVARAERRAEDLRWFPGGLPAEQLPQRRRK